MSHKQLKVEFAPPEHGWSKIILHSGNIWYEFQASYTPYDSFGDLVNELLKMSDGLQKAQIRWNSEPEEYLFDFIADGENISFKVYEIINSLVSGKVNEEKLTFYGLLYEVLYPFWKGLQEMESRREPSEYERHWHRPFPHRDMFELKQNLKKLR